MIERQMDIPTRDGSMTTFICHPERDAPHPTVVFYMDAPGIREELRDMARRLATAGHYVLLPNLYYRAGVFELGSVPSDPNAPERKRIFSLMASINVPMIMSDTQALMEHLAKDGQSSPGPMGCVGYCMSGRYAIGAAATFPGRIVAAASVYGVELVTDKPDSPHLAAQKAEAELYFACAESDPYAPLEMVEQLAQSLDAADCDAEVEIYPGTEHGFAFPKRACYDKPAAERHWERLHALFRRNLVL